jgi:hypothetical protein
MLKLALLLQPVYSMVKDGCTFNDNRLKLDWLIILAITWCRRQIFRH